MIEFGYKGKKFVIDYVNGNSLSLHPAFHEVVGGERVPLKPSSLEPFLLGIGVMLIEDYTLVDDVTQAAFPDFSREVLNKAFKTRYVKGGYFKPWNVWDTKVYKSPGSGFCRLRKWMDGSQKAIARYLYEFEVFDRSPIVKYATEVAAYFYARSGGMRVVPPKIGGVGGVDLALLYSRTSEFVNIAMEMRYSSLVMREICFEQREEEEGGGEEEQREETN